MSIYGLVSRVCGVAILAMVGTSLAANTARAALVLATTYSGAISQFDSKTVWIERAEDFVLVPRKFISRNTLVEHARIQVHLKLKEAMECKVIAKANSSQLTASHFMNKSRNGRNHE